MKYKNLKTSILTMTIALSGVAFGNRESSDITDHRYVSNATAKTVQEVIDDGYRMHDIEITDAEPLRITGSFVKNKGSYAKGWFWTVDKSYDQLADFAKEHNARPIDMEVYVVNGKRKFAGTFIRNTGSDAVEWKTFDDQSFAEVETMVDKFHGRVIDIDCRASGSTRTYSGVMIKNEGAFSKPYVYFGNRSMKEVKDLINKHKMQLTDIERIDDDKYAGVLEKADAGWWWQVGKTWEEMQVSVKQFGSRVIDIERYEENGKARFDYILINNSNALESRIGNLLRSSADGVRGFYLREVGGSLLGDLMADYQFYPASSIKTIEHAYWSYRIDKLGLSPTLQVPVYTNDGADTHPKSDKSTNQTLQLTQQKMMFNSVNADTNALQDAAANGDGVAGRAAIDQFKVKVLGLDGDLKINHKFGISGYKSANPNIGTLREFGRLYEVLTNGSIFSKTGYSYFRNNMLNETSNSGLTNGLQSVVVQEGTALGMSQAERTEFWKTAKCIWKAGNLIGTTYISCAGEVELSFKNNRGGLDVHKYVVGAFVDQVSNTTFAVGSMSGTVIPEIMRDEIRKAMKTWK